MQNEMYRIEIKGHLLDLIKQGIALEKKLTNEKRGARETYNNWKKFDEIRNKIGSEIIWKMEDCPF